MKTEQMEKILEIIAESPAYQHLQKVENFLEKNKKGLSRQMVDRANVLIKHFFLATKERVRGVMSTLSSARQKLDFYHLLRDKLPAYSKAYKFL